jgi:hypothetical protein
MERRMIRVMVTDHEKLEKYIKEEATKKGTKLDGAFDFDLDSLVMEIDDELITEGYQPFQRPLHACARIADRIGIGFTLGQKKDDFVEAVHKIYEKLYRTSDLHTPPMHIGTFMFRDIFLPVRVFVIFGEVQLSPMQCMGDVPENIIKWVFHKDETGHTLCDQWIDLYDFVYGLDDVSKEKRLPEQAIEFWLLAKQQLEGAAATLLGSIDKYTVIQNSLIAMELLLKGALLAHGMNETQAKSYGHQMTDLVEKACEAMPHADHARLKMVIGRAPKLVERRYQMKDYKRTELGQIMMDAQYVAGEVLRQFADRNIRPSLKGQSDSGADYSERYYPPLN